MMTEVFLTSEDAVKSTLNISDNVAGGYILPAIREAQDVDLREILGDALVDRLCEIVGEDKVEDYPAYKRLLDKLKYFLIYTVAAQLILKVNWKVTNAGLVQTSDDNVQPAGMGDVEIYRKWLQDRADDYCLKLQRFVVAHRADYPEIDECCCEKMRAHLDGSASCGMWLGGIRGYRIRR